MGKETFSTIGIQKQTNYALQEMSRAAFIEAVTDGLSVPPQYFFEDARINKTGYTEIDEVITNNTKALTVQEVTDAMESGVLVLDTRVADVFEKRIYSGFFEYRFEWHVCCLGWHFDRYQSTACFSY